MEVSLATSCNHFKVSDNTFRYTQDVFLFTNTDKSKCPSLLSKRGFITVLMTNVTEHILKKKL